MSTEIEDSNLLKSDEKLQKIESPIEDLLKLKSLSSVYNSLNNEYELQKDVGVVVLKAMQRNERKNESELTLVELLREFEYIVQDDDK